MASVTAISFESNGIRIISGTVAGGAFTPRQALTITEQALEAFLAGDSSSYYLVAISPENAIYETVSIPPTDPKLTPLLARNEAARNHPELKSFSCAVKVIGDIPLEGRTIRKVACCLVPSSDIQPVLEPFIRQNKVVRTLVAAPYALSPLLDNLEDGGKGTLLCAFDGGSSKTLFLREEGAVAFARSVSSNGFGWDLIDRQNVSMTMDYCFQTLRMRPSKVIVLNPIKEDDPDAPPPHLVPLPQPDFVAADPQLLQPYLIPLALAAIKQHETSSLLPLEYTEQITQQTLLKHLSTAFISATLLLALLIGLRYMVIRNEQNSITAMKRQETSLASVYRDHEDALAQRNADQPLITAMNSILSPPDIPRFLVAFDAVRSFGTSLTSISATRENESLTLQLAGAVTSGNSYAAAQLQFENFLAALQKLQGITISASQLDMTSKTFTIGATYKP